MPDRAALRAPRRVVVRRSTAVAWVGFVLAAAGAGCSQPGTQAPRPQAAKLDVGTRRISSACGYAEQLTAFGGRSGSGLGYLEGIAASGAAELASVYSHSHSWIYQGESIGGVVKDSVSLLGDCGLPGARSWLVRATGVHG